jgi:perosamine synthetase
VAIPLAKPIFDKEMEKAAVSALVNEHFVLGESVFRFEEEFAKYCNVDFAISTNSGTDALQIALKALNIATTDLVTTSPASFIATSNAILHADATPVFADIELHTYTVDPLQIEKTLAPKVKGIIPVHLYGYPASMEPIAELADKKRLFVVEDACQAHGAVCSGRKIGSWGDIACFSFYPSKNMTVGGDGGMLVTNDERIGKTAAKLRNCGRMSKYVHDLIGYSARLNTVNAALGRVQLKHLDEWNEKRRNNARMYDHLLSDVDEVILPPSGDMEDLPVYHLYVIRTKHRDGLKEWLELQGVECGINYPIPIHLQPIYRKMFKFHEGTFPKSEELSRTCLSIPMYPDLSAREIEFVSEKIREYFARS